MLGALLDPDNVLMSEIDELKTKVESFWQAAMYVKRQSSVKIPEYNFGKVNPGNSIHDYEGSFLITSFSYSTPPELTYIKVWQSQNYCINLHMQSAWRATWASFLYTLLKACNWHKSHGRHTKLQRGWNLISFYIMVPFSLDQIFTAILWGRAAWSRIPFTEFQAIIERVSPFLSSQGQMLCVWIAISKKNCTRTFAFLGKGGKCAIFGHTDVQQDSWVFWLSRRTSMQEQHLKRM